MSINAQGPKQNPTSPRSGRVAPATVLAAGIIMAAVAGYLTDWKTAVSVFQSVLALYTYSRPSP